MVLQYSVHAFVVLRPIDMLRPHQSAGFAGEMDRGTQR
jgi:hypothetical protein